VVWLLKGFAMLEIPLSGIKKIEEIAQSSNEYVSLSQGSIKIGGIPQQVKTYVQGLLNSDKTDYYESCWGLKIFREKIADTLNVRYGTHLGIANVLPTHGCIGGLSLIYLALLNPGDEVILPEPAYPAYQILAQAARCEVKYVSSLVPGTKSTWQLDVEGIKKAITPKTKLIVLSNPTNPIGNIVTTKVLEELIALCDQRGIYLVIDEAYREYVFGQDYTTSITMLHKSPFVICANSFSKSMAMSGWRVGYLLVHEQITKNLAGMQDALLNCLNNTAQYGAMFALDHPELSQEMHVKVLRNRDYALERLQPLIDRGIFSVQKPDGGFFLFLRSECEDATDLCMDILYKAKVGLIPGKTFGPSAAPFIRLCYARDADVLEEGMDRIVKYFTK
jgi:aspartate/methionine/tyrosine aminotransferase